MGRPNRATGLAHGPFGGGRAAALACHHFRRAASHWARVAALLAGLLAGLGVSSTAAAEQTHVVAQGQSLARIARRYRVTIAALAAANHMPPDRALRPGQVLTVPARGTVYVRPGDTLARVARNHDVRVDDLAKHNRLRRDAQLRVGQRLVLPGFEAAEAQEQAEKRWGRPKRPGVATLYRVWSEERRRVRLVDSRGRVRLQALRQLRHLMRPKDSRRRRDPPRRLVSLLARISDHFGGRPMHIVSGLRLPRGLTKRSSRHVDGHAIDFRIPGVPLTALRDFCQSLPRVGVGYYPNSHFIHLDVRKKNGRWTDWSRPGEPPRRRRNPTGQEPPDLASAAATDDEH